MPFQVLRASTAVAGMTTALAIFVANEPPHRALNPKLGFIGVVRDVFIIEKQAQIATKAITESN